MYGRHVRLEILIKKFLKIANKEIINYYICDINENMYNNV